jgi:hypothetical protein
MIMNAMQYRSQRQSAASNTIIETEDLSPIASATSAAEAMMNYHVARRKTERCGGIWWTYSRMLNGTLAREEGVFFHVRTLACFFAQTVVFMWICTFAYFLLHHSDKFKGGPVEVESQNSTSDGRRQLGRVHFSSYNHLVPQSESQTVWGSTPLFAASKLAQSPDRLKLTHARLGSNSSDLDMFTSNMTRGYLEAEPQFRRQLQSFTISSDVIFYNVTGINVSLVDIPDEEAWPCIQQTVAALARLNFSLESLTSVVLPDPTKNSTIFAACEAPPDLYDVFRNAPGSTVSTIPPAPVLSDWVPNYVFYNLTYSSFEALNETSLSYESATGLACVRSVVATYLALGLELELVSLLLPAAGWSTSEVFAVCEVPIEGVEALEDISIILRGMLNGFLPQLFYMNGFDFLAIDFSALSWENVKVLNCMEDVADSFAIVDMLYLLPLSGEGLFYSCGATEELLQVVQAVQLPTVAPAIDNSTSDEKFGYADFGVSESGYLLSATFGVVVALVAGLYVSLVFLPSYVSTVLQFRYGIIPSYADVEFNMYRYAIDVSTV